MAEQDLPVPAPNPEFAVPATDEQLERAATALTAHMMQTIIVDSGEDARQLVLRLVPAGAEVHMGASVTMDSIGVTEDIEESARYNAVRPRLRQMDRETQAREMRKLAGAPDYMLGSVHAVTEDGSLLWASMTGSQLGPYTSGAGKVILAVGHQKIVPDFDQGLRRIREHSFPVEDARMREAYGRGSAINKILVIDQEVVRDRIHVILIREVLGA